MQSVRKVRMMVVGVVVVVIVIGLLLDPPAEVKEVVDGAGKAERAVGVVAVDVVGLVEEAAEERVVEVGDRDDETAGGAVVFVLGADLNGEPSFLHLHLLVVVVRHGGVSPSLSVWSSGESRGVRGIYRVRSEGLTEEFWKLKINK